MDFQVEIIEHLVIYMIPFNLTWPIGTKMYTEGAIQFYNLFYTAIPIVLYGVYDTDLPSKIIYKYPQLYKSGIENLKFNVSPFKSFCLLYI